MTSANVRVVVVDDNEQPRYLQRAAELESAMLAVAEQMGLQAADMPGLHGLCVEAMRTADRHGR